MGPSFPTVRMAHSVRTEGLSSDQCLGGIARTSATVAPKNPLTRNQEHIKYLPKVKHFITFWWLCYAVLLWRSLVQVISLGGFYPKLKTPQWIPVSLETKPRLYY